MCPQQGNGYNGDDDKMDGATKILTLAVDRAVLSDWIVLRAPLLAATLHVVLGCHRIDIVHRCSQSFFKFSAAQMILSSYALIVYDFMVRHGRARGVFSRKASIQNLTWFIDASLNVSQSTRLKIHEGGSSRCAGVSICAKPRS